MLPTRLGINGIDLDAWLSSEAVQARLEALHQKHLEDSVRTFGILDLPRNLQAAFEAAAEVAKRDTIALVHEIVKCNNELLAAQLEQIGVDTSSVIAPEAAFQAVPGSSS